MKTANACRHRSNGTTRESSDAQCRNLLLALVVGMAAAVVTAAGNGERTVTPQMKAMIARTRSFGLGRYPISFWSYTNLKQHAQYMDETEVDEWADAGFTVPQSPSFDPSDPEQVAHIRRLLDWAGERGMKLIVSDPRCRAHWREEEGQMAVPDDYADGVRAAAEQIGDHPALFGFHVGDEPDAHVKDAFFECYRIQKSVAPKLHPFANLLPFFPGIEARAGTDTWPNYLDEFVTESNADLISYDCYVQMNPGRDGWQSYFENLRLYREAALRHGVPFWNTALSVGHFRYRCPNYDELRWQFNTTIASGAHGLLWFFYYMRQPHCNYRLSPVDEHWDRTQTYYDIRRIQKSFHRFYGDLFTRLACVNVMFNPEPLGGGTSFAPSDLVSRITPEPSPVMLGQFVDLQGRPYLMLVNLSMTESHQVGLTFPVPGTRLFSWNWNGREYEGHAYCQSGAEHDENGLTVRHFLAPGQEAVYRVQLPTGP